MDKLLEDVQSGLHPITAYHLLFPTHNRINLSTKYSAGDRALTTSSSLTSFPSTNLANTDNDLIASTQSMTDLLIGYSVNANDSNTPNLTNGMKSRSSTTTFERSSSGVNDSEHNNESISTLNNNNNSSMVLLSNSDEKESRRIIDIQCKLKTKEARSSSVIKGCIIKIYH